jgi:hypothetical protein
LAPAAGEPDADFDGLGDPEAGEDGDGEVADGDGMLLGPHLLK